MTSAAPSPSIERVEAWGMTEAVEAPVLRPRIADEYARAFEEARRSGGVACLRGAGRSYGDAALVRGGTVVTGTDFSRVLELDEQAATVRIEPGLTIEGLWRHVLPHGFWPTVVPGTMFPTLGGCAAMNIHGKNAFQAGTIGRHVRSFKLLTPAGEHHHVTRESDPDLFRTALGSFGMLGAFTELELELKRVHSGNLRVRAIATPTLEEMLSFVDDERTRSDYLVGWVDILGGGRGLVHQAWYPGPGEDEPGALFDPSAQDLPSRILGVIPKSWTWPLLWCALNPLGMRVVNALKYGSGRWHAKHPPFLQGLVGFSFLLDYVPNWKYAYKPGGLIQYQSFVPKEAALDTFEAQMRLAREHGIRPYLGVLKRHLPEDFVLSHAVDGFSMAMDFPAGRGTARERFRKLCAAMDEVVIANGGRFYFAKDATLRSGALERIWPAEELALFREQKARHDPDGILQSELSRRLLG